MLYECWTEPNDYELVYEKNAQFNVYRTKKFPFENPLVSAVVSRTHATKSLWYKIVFLCWKCLNVESVYESMDVSVQFV